MVGIRLHKSKAIDHYPVLYLVVVLLVFSEAICSLRDFQRLPLPFLSAEFCSETSSVSDSRRACPVPSTYDSISIEQYLGRWFEIGTTAGLKLQNDAGLICCRANYTLAAPRVSGQGAKITVVNMGFPMLGTVATLGVTRVSTAAASVCSHARAMCSLTTKESPIREALYEISRVVVEISSPYAANASLLSEAIVTISSSLQKIGFGLSSMSAHVSEIQMINGRVSQAIGKKENNLEALNKSIRLTMSKQSELAQLVSEIARARESVLFVAKALILQPKYTEAAARLLQAAESIDKQTRKMMEMLTQTELQLIAMGAASSSIAVDQSKPPQEWASVVGQAVQNYTSPGKLLVTMQGFSGPYWIIGLEGNAENGYSAALVYSCVQDQDDELHEALLILSRTTHLAQDIIDRFLTSAKLSGILTDCQNPFLLTLQNCSSPAVEMI